MIHISDVGSLLRSIDDKANTDTRSAFCPPYSVGGAVNHHSMQRSKMKRVELWPLCSAGLLSGALVAPSVAVGA